MQVVDFYEFYEGLQEGWDGPALLVFSDGDKIGARLDRNGLRPARFWRTNDDVIYVASEVRFWLVDVSCAARRSLSDVCCGLTQSLSPKRIVPISSGLPHAGSESIE